MMMKKGRRARGREGAEEWREEGIKDGQEKNDRLKIRERMKPV